MAKPIGLAKFMRAHFYHIARLRNEGLTFLQIADAFPDMPRPRCKDKDLAHCYRGTFQYVRKSFPDIHISNIFNQGIASFVRDHFDKISSLRASGFSWREIISHFNLKHRFPLSRNLRYSLKRAFQHISKERLNRV